MKFVQIVYRNIIHRPVFFFPCRKQSEQLLVHGSICFSVSMGFFDDILIPADAMQHPSRLYPRAYCIIDFFFK
jgi:hypothetical protein